MPAIPLSFVISLLLIILLVRVLAQGEALLRPATVFIGACIVLVTTVGLRWSSDIQIVRFLQPFVAALLPSIAWICFSDLRRPFANRRWPHFLPAGMILFLSAMWHRWHPPIDLVLALLYFGYGFSLLHRAYAGSDSFEGARLTDAAEARRAVLLVGWLLCCSGVIDLLVAVDFDFYQGSHAASIVGVANMLTLPLVAYAVTIIGRSAPEAQPSSHSAKERQDDSSPEKLPETEGDSRIMEAIETIMREKRLFRDPDLTLNRLSRRLGIPSRQISGTINRTLGRNVSQAVNEYRIRDAQRFLLETDLPVTTIIFECGFQTKSNFNREFARVTGMTPSDYRRSGTMPSTTPLAIWPE
ncbi:AraC family transcriptional regulator [Pararhizobium sp. LjRoot255]|uniref:helix-turn-helix domain-containing protein n=1 Tax=Pararhizobium sp. LjRoot255 TaxID=3342298 RepID=UPI003ECD20F1